MKFGYYLRQQTFMPWSTHYIQYDRIKALIREESQDWEKIDQWLQAEYTKIQTFLSQKTDALDYQLQLVKQDESTPLDDLIYPLYDLHELVRYLNLSISGFEKLLKSLDKRRLCKSTLHSLPISLDKYYPPLDELLVRIDGIKQKRLHCKKSLFSFPSCATRPLPPLPDEDQRITSYFWIHPDHVFELKAMLLFHCNLDSHHTLTSTYLDNSQWEVYHALLNEQMAESMELCWINATSLPNVQVNHTVKRENGTGYYLKRYSIPQTSVDTLFQPHSPDQDDASARTALVVEPKKTSSFGLLADIKKESNKSRIEDTIRRRILQDDWERKVTCTRRRSTFTSIDKMSLVEIQLDTNFSQAKQATSKRPTGLSLMVVTQSSKDSPRTEWLKELVEKNEWIHAVPRFSYHTHFVSQYFYDQLAYLPWWLDSFDRLWRMETTRRTGLSWTFDLEPVIHEIPPPWHSHLVVEMDEKRLLLPKSTNTIKVKMKKKAGWTKVEPKVFFANERTFLSWLQFCALLLTVSLNMMNFGGQEDQVSRGCGAMFMILTILLALYALAKYEFRAWHLITQSTRYRFDDVYGPAILCTLLVVAMLINIGLRLNTTTSL